MDREGQRMEHGRRIRGAVAPAVIIGVIVVVAVVYVVLSLRRPAIETFQPTAVHEVEAGGGLVGPVTYTIDASDGNAWVYFDFSRSGVITAAAPVDWDLAFRRFHVIANGGPGFAGRAGIIDLGEVPFDSVLEAPAAGYVETVAGRDSVNSAIARWYAYGFTSHVLRSKGHVYAVRAADGRYAKLQVISYYCPGALPGCMTIRYTYQASGDRRFTRDAGPWSEPADSAGAAGG